jgi:hypothetical protein
VEQDDRAHHGPWVPCGISLLADEIARGPTVVTTVVDERGTCSGVTPKQTS